MLNFLHDFMAALVPPQKPADNTRNLFASGLVTLRDQDNLPDLIAQIAESQVGIREDGGNNCGKQVREYQRATWLTPGVWAWCAAFVCWVVFQALKFHGGAKWQRPQTAGAYDFEAWASGKYDANVAKLWRVLDPKSTVPKRGDIVTFAKVSHIGIVTGFNGHLVQTVEGNTSNSSAVTRDNPTGDGVFAKQHKRDALRRIIRYIG